MALTQKLPPLDNRTFDDLVAEARTRIPRYTQEWTDFNEGDTGMALVQLMAWMSELLIYRTNRVPELAHLKFLELIGITLEPARPAEAFLSFAAEPGWPQATIELPRRTQIAAGAGDEAGPIVFETKRRLIVFTARMDAVQTYVGGIYLDQTEANEAAETAWAPFAESADPGSALVLGFAYDGTFPVNIELALTFWLDQGGRSAPAACGVIPVGPTPKLVWEGFDGRDWRPVTVLKDDTGAFTRSGEVFLKTPAAGLLQRARLGTKSDVTEPVRYWLRVRVERKGWDRPPRLLAVRANTVRADQGETIEGEVLGGSDGRADQTFTLSSAPVIAGSLQLDVDEGQGFEPWQEVDDFTGSGPSDPHYLLDRSTATVRLGDGLRGHVPVANPDRPRSSIRAASYRFGGGRRGNVGPGALTTLLSPIEGIDAAVVTNLFAAAGGTDEETLDAAKERAARALKSRGRAVTSQDFEDIAMSAGPVARAKALPLYHPSFPETTVPGVVTVIIVADVDGPAPLPSDLLLRQVCACLDAARLLTTEVYVVPPRYLPVRVTAELVALPEADEAELKEAALQLLDRFFHPLTGGTEGTGWPFGGDIFFSSVHRALSDLAVERVAGISIELDGKTYPPCTDVPVPPGVLLQSVGHEVSVFVAEEELA
jgi:predicted phage baseplate assembly protein